MAAQLTGTNGRLARGPSAWMALASSSLPVPVSPWISTGTSRPSALRARSMVAST